MQSVSAATPRANSKPSIPPSGLRRSQVYPATVTAYPPNPRKCVLKGLGVQLEPGAVVDHAGRAQVVAALEPGDSALGARPDPAVGVDVQSRCPASHVVAAATNAE